MAILSDSTIRRLHETGILGISPFHDDALQPASYDMRLHWSVLVSPTRYERGQEVDLRDEPDQTLHVDPGRFVGVLSEERLRFPLTVAARFGLRSEFTRHGLIAFGGIQIDPGFRGRLALSLFHAGPEPMPLRSGRPMFTVEFQYLDTPATGEYKGDFQDQDNFPSVQKEFILNAHTASLAEINSLPGEIGQVLQRLTLHESITHGPRLSMTWEEMAEAQSVAPVDDPDTLCGGWPEDEDFDSFFETIQSSRRRSA